MSFTPHYEIALLWLGQRSLLIILTYDGHNERSDKNNQQTAVY
jgi:hypothetical protein